MILCTKTDEARVRIVTSIIGRVHRIDDGLVGKICSTRCATNLIAFEPSGVHGRAIYAVAAIVRLLRDHCSRRFIGKARSSFFFFRAFRSSRATAPDIFSARLAFVEDPNEDKLIPRSPIFLSLSFFFSFTTFPLFFPSIFNARVKNLRRVSPRFGFIRHFAIDVRAIVERMNFIVGFSVAA